MNKPKSEKVKIIVHGRKRKELDFQFNYGFMKKICHQKPDRSFFIFGKQLPLCARCLGLYFSFLIGIIIAIANFKILSQYEFYQIIIFFLICVAPLLIDGFTQLYKLRKSNNLLRLITGLIAGFGVSVFLVYSIGYLILSL